MSEFIGAPRLIEKIVNHQVKQVLIEKERHDMAEAGRATDKCGCANCRYIQRRRAEWWNHPREVTNGEGEPIINQAEKLQGLFGKKSPDDIA